MNHRSKFMRNAVAMGLIVLVGWGIYLVFQPIMDEFAGAAVSLVSAKEGGVLISNDGHLTLEIPPGALIEDTTISLISAAVEELPQELQDLPGVGPAYRLEPDGLTFRIPVTVKLQLTGEDLAGAHPRDGIGVYALIAKTDEKEPEPLDELKTVAWIDDGTVEVQGKLDHFSWLVKSDPWPFGWVTVRLERVAPSYLVGKQFSAKVQVDTWAPADVRAKIEPRGYVAVRPLHEGVRGFLGGEELLRGQELVDGTAEYVCSDEPGHGAYGLRVIFLIEDLHPPLRPWYYGVIQVVGNVECVEPEEPAEAPPPRGDPPENVPPEDGITDEGPESDSPGGEPLDEVPLPDEYIAVANTRIEDGQVCVRGQVSELEYPYDPAPGVTVNISYSGPKGDGQAQGISDAEGIFEICFPVDVPGTYSIEGGATDGGEGFDLEVVVPIKVGYHSDQGFSHYNQGDLEAALIDFDRAIGLDPQYALAYYGLGLVHDGLGDTMAAIADYEQFLMLYFVEDEFSATARERIEVLSDYERAVEVSYHSDLGFSHYNQGDLEAALIDFERAIGLDSQYALAYYGLGIVHDGLGDTLAAIADYEQFLMLYLVEDEFSDHAYERIEILLKRLN